MPPDVIVDLGRAILDDAVAGFSFEADGKIAWDAPQGFQVRPDPRCLRRIDEIGCDCNYQGTYRCWPSTLAFGHCTNCGCERRVFVRAPKRGKGAVVGLT